MGPKRGFGNVDSSGDEDDFQPEDGLSSPAFSRLKRKRRSSGRERSLTPGGSVQGCELRATEGRREIDDDDDEVICIPDSMEDDDDVRDDDKPVEETPVSKENASRGGEMEREVEGEPGAEDEGGDDDEDEEEGEEAAVDNGCDDGDDDDDNRSEASDENEFKGKAFQRMHRNIRFSRTLGPRSMSRLSDNVVSRHVSVTVFVAT